MLEFASLSQVHETHRRVLASGIARESVPGATTLYVEALPHLGLNGASLVAAIDKIPSAPTSGNTIRTHTVSVRYDGPDLADVAILTGFTVNEVIARHCAPLYTVAFVGFSRSFPYFAGLDHAIMVPRLATPRTLVPKGSVGIGAGFTGIYPAASPGGWRLLGTTDLEFFDSTIDPPNGFATGDLVRFVPVTP